MQMMCIFALREAIIIPIPSLFVPLRQGNPEDKALSGSVAQKGRDLDGRENREKTEWRERMRSLD